MGDLLKPAPIEQPKPLVAAAAAPSTGANPIFEQVAAGAAPAEADKAREELSKQGELARGSVVIDTRGDLSSLISTLKPQNPDSRHLVAAASAATAYNTFQTLIANGKHDFEDQDSDLKSNDTFGELCKLMQTNVYQRIDTKYDPQYQKEWMDACNQFMAKEVADYEGVFTTRMNKTDVTQAVTKMLDEKEGVGSFETFMSKKHPDIIAQVTKASETQKIQATQDTEQQKALMAKKTEATKSFEAIKGGLAQEVAALPEMKSKLDGMPARITAAKDATELASIEAEIAKLGEIGAALKYASAARKDLETLNCPPDQLKKINDISKSIIDSNGTNLATKQGDIDAVVNSQKPMLEKLAGLAKDADIPQDVRTTTIERVKKGELEVDQAIKDLEGAKKMAAELEKEPDADDKSLVGTVTKWAKKMPGLGWLAGALTSISVALVKIPWIGDWFRGSMISNKMLAANGDKRAQIAYKGEKELKRFGLEESAVASLGEEPVNKALKALLKPTELSSDPTEQAQITQLANQIKEKGGMSASNVTLNEFIGNNPKWVNIQYDASAAALAEAKARDEAAKKTDTATPPAAGTAATPPAEGAPKTS